MPSGFNPVLAEWGGEAISFTAAGDALEPRLRRIGRPAIVTAAVEIAPSPNSFSGLTTDFVGRLLELPGVGREIHYRAPIPVVEQISFPGDSGYDRFVGLVRN